MSLRPVNRQYKIRLENFNFPNLPETNKPCSRVTALSLPDITALYEEMMRIQKGRCDIRPLYVGHKKHVRQG